MVFERCLVGLIWEGVGIGVPGGGVIEEEMESNAFVFHGKALYLGLGLGLGLG